MRHWLLCTLLIAAPIPLLSMDDDRNADEDKNAIAPDILELPPDLNERLFTLGPLSQDDRVILGITLDELNSKESLTEEPTENLQTWFMAAQLVASTISKHSLATAGCRQELQKVYTAMVQRYPDRARAKEALYGLADYFTDEERELDNPDQPTAYPGERSYEDSKRKLDSQDANIARIDTHKTTLATLTAEGLTLTQEIASLEQRLAALRSQHEKNLEGQTNHQRAINYLGRAKIVLERHRMQNKQDLQNRLNGILEHIKGQETRETQLRSRIGQLRLNETNCPNQTTRLEISVELQQVCAEHTSATTQLTLLREKKAILEFRIGKIDDRRVHWAYRPFVSTQPTI